MSQESFSQGVNQLRSNIDLNISRLQDAKKALSGDIDRDALTEVREQLIAAHACSSSASALLRPINKIVYALKPGERPPLSD